MSEKQRCYFGQVKGVFGPDEVVRRVRPKESLEWLPNPHRGTQTFQRFNGQALYPGLKWDDRKGPIEFPPPPKSDEELINIRYPRTTVSYCRWIWKVLEPQPGEFRFDIIENALKAARERGQTLHIRLQPYASDDVPEWLWKMGIKMFEKTERRREPDCNDPIYVKYYLRMIQAFAKKFNGHPDLETVDIVHGGPWGEGGGNATPKTAKLAVDTYLKAWPDTVLTSMYHTEAIKYAAKLKNAIGWRCDCIGDLRMKSPVPDIVPDTLIWNHMFDYVKWLEKDGVKNAWQRAPVTLETCWVVGHWRNQGWNFEWIIDQMLKYHPTFFMPKSCYIPSAWKKQFDAFDRKLGYRFVLRQVLTPTYAAPGSTVNFEFWIDNDGVAPLYNENYKLALRYRQGSKSEVVFLKQKPQSWTPGHNWFEEKVKLPSFIKPGQFDLDLGIVDTRTKKARIRFAIEKVGADGWFPLYSIPDRNGDPNKAV